jgi:hypothetical protein
MESITVEAYAKRKGQRIHCVSSLKEIGEVYRLWADTVINRPKPIVWRK